MNLSIKIATTLLVLFQLFVLSHQVPSVNCGVSDVLEEEIYDATTPTENCDDKFVCQLECSFFTETKKCDYTTFLDLTELLKKDKNNKNAYNKACKSGIVNIDYLGNPVSLKFRQLVGLISHISQESFFLKFIKNKKLIKKYPDLYKTSFEKIKKLPIYQNKEFLKVLSSFEFQYVKAATENQSDELKWVIWGLYHFVKGLMGSKKLCYKHFEEMKDKSEKAVASMIVSEIQKQSREALKEAKTSSGKVCDSFCTVYKQFLKVKQNPKWLSYFKTNKKVLLDLYARDMAKKMIKKNSEVSYCRCKKIFTLNKLIKKGASISKHFDEGYNLDEFQRYANEVCNEKCGLGNIDEED
jgi:hypothetical protein